MWLANFFNMKRAFLFICGIIVGVGLTIITKAIINKVNSSDNVIELFETEGPCMGETSFKVFHVLGSGDALAKENNYDFFNPLGLMVLFLVEDGPYYDGQVIQVPSSDYCVKQIGIYRYTTASNINRTVPVVAIRKKD